MKVYDRLLALDLLTDLWFKGKATIVLNDEKSLGDYPEIKAGGEFRRNIDTGSIFWHIFIIATIGWKDLGPQIAWRTVCLLSCLFAAAY